MKYDLIVKRLSFSIAFLIALTMCTSAPNTDVVTTVNWEQHVQLLQKAREQAAARLGQIDNVIARVRRHDISPEQLAAVEMQLGLLEAPQSKTATNRGKGKTDKVTAGTKTRKTLKSDREFKSDILDVSRKIDEAYGKVSNN